MNPKARRWVALGWRATKLGYHFAKWVGSVLFMSAIILIAFNSGKWIGAHHHIHTISDMTPPVIHEQDV